MSTPAIYSLVNELLDLGGPGSGNWGHAGRPGKRGGSAPGGGSNRIGASKSDTAQQRRDKAEASRHMDVEPSSTYSQHFRDAVLTADVIGSRPLNEGVQTSALVTFANGDKAIWKPYDPQNGWNHPRCAAQEVAAYQVSEFMGWEIVPQTEFMTHNGMTGSAQKWIDGADVGSIGRREETATDIYRTMALDLIIGNRDRHSSNFLTDPDGHFWAIDHGFARRTLRSPADKRDILNGSEAMRQLEGWGRYSIQFPQEVIKEVHNHTTANLKAHLRKSGIPDETADRMAENLGILQSWDMTNLY